jgi:hypothetical protein
MNFDARYRLFSDELRRPMLLTLRVTEERKRASVTTYRVPHIDTNQFATTTTLHAAAARRGHCEARL